MFRFGGIHVIFSPPTADYGRRIWRMSSCHTAEQIELLRGDSVVSSLAGAFGSGLRETRLTASQA